MDVYAAVMFVNTAWCKGMWAAVRLLGGIVRYKLRICSDFRQRNVFEKNCNTEAGAVYIKTETTKHQINLWRILIWKFRLRSAL